MAITRIGNIANTIPDNSIANSKFTDIVNFKNIIINGDMSIAQRGTSSSGVTSGGYSTVDRFNTQVSSLGTWTISQDTDVPTGQGFAKSLKMDCTTANASPSSSSNVRIIQPIEGQNLQYLKKGTANAESVTVSFWVKSNKTGTYIVELLDNDNLRTISTSYTINSASTWEKKTITFAGDTTGTLDNDNGASLYLLFWLGAGPDYTSSGTLQTTWNSYDATKRAVGQVNLADSTSNDFWITGVQLEAGTTASDFEFLPYDVNLLRCQRYYQEYGGVSNFLIGGYQGASSDDYGSMLMFFCEMRATPTITITGSWSRLNVTTTEPKVTRANKKGACIFATTSSAGTWYFDSNSADDLIKVDAEL